MLWVRIQPVAPKRNTAMRHYVKLIVACVFAMTAFTAHAGLFDELGTALRGDTKKESPKPDTTSTTDNPPRNLVAAPASSTGKRVALVIGNGNYHYDNLPKLPNPTHDAEDIAKALRGFGFEVIEIKDQSLEGMNEAITEFGRKIADSDAALFYFAGHGLQVKGQNYLVPTNARIESESQVPYQSINVNQLLDEMDNSKSRANIVMLDACRNNPISGKFRSGATRGLAAPTSQPKGTVIVYATDPGNVAADGTGRNGLFTAGLLAAFKGGDLSLHGVLVRASKEVEHGSNKTQIPYINGPATLQEEFHFGHGTRVASLVPVPVRVKSPDEIEDDYWNDIKDSKDLTSYEHYSKAHPTGRYLNTANLRIAQLRKKAQEALPVTAPPAPVKPTPFRDDPDTALWTEAQKGNSREDYQAYLSQYSKGKYVALAKARLKKLDDEAAQQAKQEREALAQQAAQAKAEAVQQEQGAWDSANSTASEASYQDYLDTYPKGRYVTLAQARIAKLRKEAATAAAQQAKQEREAAARQEADRQRQQAEAAQAKQKQEAERKRKQAETPTSYVSQGGLTWMPMKFYKTWSEANSYCANITIRGQSGWRLPTQDELVALYKSGAMNGQGSTLRYTWSSTPSGSGYHHGVYLSDGRVGSHSDTFDINVACVH